MLIRLKIFYLRRDRISPHEKHIIYLDYYTLTHGCGCQHIRTYNTHWKQCSLPRTVIHYFVRLQLCPFQHEEVQFLESELENQKQKYQELEEFTKSLVNAIKNNDLKTQQVHDIDTYAWHVYIILLDYFTEILP